MIRASLIAFALCAFGTLGMAAPQPALETELRRIAAEAPGTLGVRVVHLESGDGAGVNADDWFPMMSVYKLPIAIHAVRLAERGQINLKSTIALGFPDRRPGFSPLARTIEEKGPQRITIGELVESVLRVSDNTASDKLLELVGGPAAVQKMLKDRGIDGIDVSRYELEFAADYYGVCCEQKERPFSLDRFAAAVERIPASRRRESAEKFVTDRRDSAQPAGMATLLSRLVKGELANAAHTALILRAMADMHTRDTRLRAGLPPGTKVSLRPGTSGETDGIRAACNDNAIVTLPNGRGHLIVAAFLKASRGPEEARDATLAKVAAAAYAWATRSAALR